MAKNILLISVDNLRYDCIGFQPDKRELTGHDVLQYLDTPNLDGVAEKGLCFSQCISTNTYTTASHASLLTGLYPPRHGVRSFYGTKLSRDVYTLAEVLKVYGYETAMMTDTPNLFCPLELDRGFDRFFRGDDRGLIGYLRDNKQKNLFVFAHFFDIHEPFLVSKNPAYDNSDYLKEIDRLYEQFGRTKNRVPGDSLNALWMRLIDHLGYKDHKVFFPLYVRGVTKFDRGRFRDFMEGIGKAAMAEDSLVVLFSDHGEGKSSFYNPDIFGHGGPLFESVIRVPLIIRHRNLPHEVVDSVVSTVDVFPTILNYALGGQGVSALPYLLDGMNLEEPASRHDRRVYSETWQNDRGNHATPLTFVSSFLEQRGIRTGNEKFIINGTPEVFLDGGRVEKMTDEEFVRHIYRGLLCQFENYEDYVREVGYLKSRINTKQSLLKTVRESVQYVSRPSFILYDLAKDPFEERLVAIEEADGEQSPYAEEIYRIASSSAGGEEIFDSPAVFKEIAANVARLETEGILEVVGNRHILSLLIDDFLKRKRDLVYDREEIEGLIRESDEFSRFLLDRLRHLQEAGGESDGRNNAAKELEMIKNSLTWRASQRAITFFDTRLFPPGSRRRSLLARLIVDPLAAQGVADTLSDTLDTRMVQRIKTAAPGKRMLVITYEVPQFDKYSGAHRFFNLLRILRELDFSVTVLSDSPVDRPRYSGPLQNLGVDIVCGQQRFSSLKDLGQYFDYVLLHTPSTAVYIDAVKRYFQKARVIFDTSDLHYLRFQREGELTGDPDSLRKAAEYRQIELALAKKSDVVFTVSETEGELLKRDAGDLRVEIVPNIHAVNPTTNPFGKRGGIMFIGAFAHGPNADAVFYFLREIFPAVLERIETNFYIIGKNPPEDLLRLQTPNVIATGYVPDVSPYFEKCRLLVAPLRYGAGVKGKLTQSMSMGLPFVTTTVGAEGMALEDGRHCCVADDPAEFADNVVRLYTDRELWETFRENSLRLATELFSYETVRDRLKKFFEGER